MELQSVGVAVHPLAEVLPLIEGAEFDELVASVKANGLRDPIIMFEGAILDGRNRYRACLAAGVEPRTETSAAAIRRCSSPTGICTAGI